MKFISLSHLDISDNSFEGKNVMLNLLLTGADIKLTILYS